MEPESDSEQKRKARLSKKTADKTSSQPKSPQNQNLSTQLLSVSSHTGSGPDLVQSSADNKLAKHADQNCDKTEPNFNQSNIARRNHRDRGRRKNEQKIKKKDSAEEEVCDKSVKESLGKDCDKSKVSTLQAEVDPLSLDLYEKLLTETGMEENKNCNEDDNLEQEKPSDDDLSIDLYDKLCSDKQKEANRKHEKNFDEDDTNKQINSTDPPSKSVDLLNKSREDKKNIKHKKNCDEDDANEKQDNTGPPSFDLKSYGNKERRKYEENCNADDEENDAIDPLSEDLFDKFCHDKPKEDKRWKHHNARGEVVDGDCDDEESRDGDPLSQDMFDKLCEESGVEAPPVLPWNKCLVGEDLQKVCKKLSCSEKQFYTILMCIFVAVTLAMVFGLFVLQAQMSFNSKEMVGRVPMGKSKKVMPQGMYTLYYDFLDSGVLPEHVDLRANTTIFVH